MWLFEANHSPLHPQTLLPVTEFIEHETLHVSHHFSAVIATSSTRHQRWNAFFFFFFLVPHVFSSTGSKSHMCQRSVIRFKMLRELNPVQCLTYTQVRRQDDEIWQGAHFKVWWKEADMNNKIGLWLCRHLFRRFTSLPETEWCRLHSKFRWMSWGIQITDGF